MAMKPLELLSLSWKKGLMRRRRRRTSVPKRCKVASNAYSSCASRMSLGSKMDGATNVFNLFVGIFSKSFSVKILSISSQKGT